MEEDLQVITLSKPFGIKNPYFHKRKTMVKLKIMNWSKTTGQRKLNVKIWFHRDRNLRLKMGLHKNRAIELMKIKKKNKD